MAKRQKSLDGSVIVPHSAIHQRIIDQALGKPPRKTVSPLAEPVYPDKDDLDDTPMLDLMGPVDFGVFDTLNDFMLFPTTTFDGLLTSVPITVPAPLPAPLPTTNAIPFVPPYRSPPPHIENPEASVCGSLTFTIDPAKNAQMIVGITDLLMRTYKKRINGRERVDIPTPVLAALVASCYNHNDNLKGFAACGKICEEELTRRYAERFQVLRTELGVIKHTRGDQTHNFWALLHCFSRCAQCVKHTTLSAPPKANNGNVRVVEFYTRRCGCALRYCPSCVDSYYVDKKADSPKDIICWMCDTNQEYGFDRWSVKVPLETVCAVNEETTQHACCLFEPCTECKGNTRPAEAYYGETVQANLDKFRGYLASARRIGRVLLNHPSSKCSFCDNNHIPGKFWTFEGCKCQAPRPAYHMKCARQLATAFESTCALCGHEGYYKYNQTR